MLMIDSSNDNTITEIGIEEFSDAYVSFKLSQDDSVATIIFRFFDKDGDGEISLDELKLMFDDEDQSNENLTQVNIFFCDWAQKNHLIPKIK